MRKASEVSPEELKRRALDGYQCKVGDLARVTGRSPGSLYRAIRRRELEVVWIGSTPRLLPAATLKLLGVEPGQGAQEPEPVAA